MVKSEGAEYRAPKSFLESVGNESAPSREKLVLGGFWRRFLAGLLDAVVIFPVFTAFFIFWVRVIWVELPDPKLGLLEWFLMIPFSEDPLLVPGLLFGLVMGLVLLTVATILLGASPGQRVMGLRIVDGAGRRIGPFRGAFRTVCLFFSFCYLFLGILWIGFDRLRQGWHDKLAGTYVIRRDSVEF